MNKKLKIVIIAIAVIVVIILLALPKINTGNTSVQPQANRNTPLSVNAHIIEVEKLQNRINTSGSVLANEEVELIGEAAGKIITINFREGSPVNKGDLLVKINDNELQAQLTRAKYRLKLLEDKEYRQRVLFGKEAISQEEYDVSMNELNISKAEVELIEAQIEKTEIRAPFNGIVGLRNVSEGSYVTSNTVIASLQNINPVKIDFSIPERHASDVKTGDQVKFSVAGTNEIFTARVYALEPKIDPVSRTLRIRADYSNPGNRVLPGSFADVELILSETPDAIMIPSQAVIPELKGQRVFLYKNGTAAAQSIETGVRTDQHVQVTSGINPGDTLITSGILQLRPGMPVNLSEFN
jgi:membrane fusion protein, multidrug efflux system